MKAYISAELRRQVIARAGKCCEYCRLTLSDRAFPFAIDHIQSEKHGGKTELDNLCLACFRCNSFKGSDVAGVDPLTGLTTLLFNPRKHLWESHFTMEEGLIIPKSPEARLTVIILRLNATSQLIPRTLLLEQGRYPCVKE